MSDGNRRKGSLWSYLSEKRKAKREAVANNDDDNRRQIMTRSFSSARFTFSLSPRISPRIAEWFANRKGAKESAYINHPFWQADSQISVLICERISLNLGRYCIYSEEMLGETMSLTISKEPDIGMYRVKRENATHQLLSDDLMDASGALAILDDMVDSHPKDVIVRSTTPIPRARTYSRSGSFLDDCDESSELATIVHTNVPIAPYYGCSEEESELATINHHLEDDSVDMVAVKGMSVYDTDNFVCSMYVSVESALEGSDSFFSKGSTDSSSCKGNAPQRSASRPPLPGSTAPRRIIRSKSKPPSSPSTASQSMGHGVNQGSSSLSKRYSRSLERLSGYASSFSSFPSSPSASRHGSSCGSQHSSPLDSPRSFQSLSSSPVF